MNSNSYSWVSDDKKNCTYNSNNNNTTTTQEKSFSSLSHTHTPTPTPTPYHRFAPVSLCVFVCPFHVWCFRSYFFLKQSKKLNAPCSPHFCPFAFYILSTSCISFSLHSFCPHIFLWYCCCCCCRLSMCPCYSIWIYTPHTHTHKYIFFLLRNVFIMQNDSLTLSFILTHIHTHNAHAFILNRSNQIEI